MAVARWWSGGAWPEAKVLAQVQASSPALRVAVCNLNAQFEGQVIRTDGGVPVHFPVLDPEVPQHVRSAPTLQSDTMRW